jgi:chloride channel 2
MTKFFMNMLPDHYNYTLLFLLILGILVALVGVSMDLLISEINSFHHMMAPISGNSSYAHNYAAQYFVWVLFSVIFLLCAVFLTKNLAPAAAGSGIPEMKNILSGVYLSEYLSFKTLSVKVLGLVFTVGSGIFIGKEGPLVHAASIIAHQLSKLTIFERIRKVTNSHFFLINRIRHSCRRCSLQVLLLELVQI